MQSRGVASPDDVDALACTFEVNPPRSDRLPRGGAGVQIAAGVDAGMFE